MIQLLSGFLFVAFIAQVIVVKALLAAGLGASLIMTVLAAWLLVVAAAVVITLQAKRQMTQSRRAQDEANLKLAASLTAANQDPLTGLLSLNYLKHRLEDILKNAGKRHETCAVLYLDLDNLKDFNEAYGFDLGTSLLASVGKRLKTSIKGGDLAGYFGSDEFVVVLPLVNDVMSAEIVARRILTSVAEPFEVEGRSLTITTSIGIAIGHVDGVDSDTVISHAESAAKMTKNNGRKGYSFYSQQLNEFATNRLSIDQRLRGALKRDEFTLVYQPIIDMKSNELKGFEALLRWHNPHLGDVSPVDFIPIAEQIGLIGEIGQWVLKEACIQLQIWQSKYGKRLLMSVNVSARQFQEKTIVPTVEAVIEQTGIQARSLQIELTEGLLLNMSDAVFSDVNQLSTLGVNLALDDFGTGYSSLAYVNKIPFDVLKVDKSFVDGLCEHPRDFNMVKSMISIAHSLDMSVVVEGVERTEQLTKLKELGADSIQGYVFSKPLSPSDAERLYLAER